MQGWIRFVRLAGGWRLEIEWTANRRSRARERARPPQPGPDAGARSR